jgi:hypothetical protein
MLELAERSGAPWVSPFLIFIYDPHRVRFSLVPPYPGSGLGLKDDPVLLLQPGSAEDPGCQSRVTMYKKYSRRGKKRKEKKRKKKRKRG